MTVLIDVQLREMRWIYECLLLFYIEKVWYWCGVVVWFGVVQNDTGQQMARTTHLFCLQAITRSVLCKFDCILRRKWNWYIDIIVIFNDWHVSEISSSKPMKVIQIQRSMHIAMCENRKSENFSCSHIDLETKIWILFYTWRVFVYSLAQ